MFEDFRDIVYYAMVARQNVIRLYFSRTTGIEVFRLDVRKRSHRFLELILDTLATRWLRPIVIVEAEINPEINQ